MIIFNKEEIRMLVKELAMIQHNKPYVWGNFGPDTFDCAGLTWYVYNEILGVDIMADGYGKSTTTMQLTSDPDFTTIVDKDDANKSRYLDNINIGDILFFHRNSMSDNQPTADNFYPGHCGIYLGNRNFIHASKPKSEVIISNFDSNPYWLEVFVGTRDVVTSYAKRLKAPKIDRTRRISN